VRQASISLSRYVRKRAGERVRPQSNSLAQSKNPLPTLLPAYREREANALVKT